MYFAFYIDIVNIDNDKSFKEKYEETFYDWCMKILPIVKID